MKRRRGPHLPQAFVGLPPCAFEEVEQRDVEMPALWVGRDTDASDVVQRVGDLAVHVGVELGAGGVADPHRGRAVVAGQVGELDLGEPTFAGHAVHDLQAGRCAGHGAQEPVPPGDRLAHVAGTPNSA